MDRPSRSNIRRLALGRFISVAGSSAAFTALSFTIWDRTHSPWMQALALLLTFGVSGLVGPFAGALGDRYDRKAVMIWSEGVAAVFFLAMSFAHATPLLLAAAFAAAVAESPFWSASRASIPNLAADESEISWANSLFGVGWSSGVAIGPVIGGLLVGLIGPEWVFALNAASFLVSLLVTLSIRGRFSDPTTSAADAHEHQGLMAGVRFLLKEPVLRRLVIAFSVFILGLGMGMVADAPLAESFGAGPTGLGLLVAAWGVGAVIGNGSGRWLTPRREYLWIVYGAFGISAAALVVGFASSFLVALVALFVFGTCEGLSIVAENGVMQRRTPDAVRSRAMAAFEALLSLGLAAAYVLAGPVLTLVGPHVVYRIGGITALAAAIILLPLLRLAPSRGSRAGASTDSSTQAV
jgi:MFS family permease